jgi:hypothetical protein
MGIKRWDKVKQKDPQEGNKTTGVKIISWQEMWAIRGKFQGEDDLEELPCMYTNTNCQR